MRPIAEYCFESKFFYIGDTNRILHNEFLKEPTESEKHLENAMLMTDILKPLLLMKNQGRVVIPF